MAKQRLKLIVSSPAWRAKGRYKINENVSYSGKNWQNSTGINSEPGIGSDWVEVGGGGGGNFYPMTGNSDTNPVTGDLYIKGNIVSQTSTTASGVTTTKEYDIDSMGTYAREEVFGGGSDIVRQVETDIYNGFGHVIENGSNTKSIIVTAELGVVADHYIDKEDDPFAYAQMEDIANAVGDFIPLSGTAGNPITGMLEFEGDYIGLEFAYGNGFILPVNGNELHIGMSDSKLQLKDGEVTLNTGSVTNHKGFVGSSYYGANYTDETYIQRKYVTGESIEIDETTEDITTPYLQNFIKFNGNDLAVINLPDPTINVGKKLSIRNITDANTGNLLTLTGTIYQDGISTSYYDVIPQANVIMECDGMFWTVVQP